MYGCEQQQGIAESAVREDGVIGCLLSMLCYREYRLIVTVP